MINSGFEDLKDNGEDQLSASLTPLETGSGTTCRIYKTKILGKWLFVKEIKPELRHDSRLVEAFRKEMEIGFQLDHPGLPRYVLTKGILPEGQYVAMEFIDGLTLEDFVKSHPDYFSEPAHVKKFIREMSDVLHYLHSHQVLHLDLKPSNLMLTRIDRGVKLVDLGYCRSDAFQDTAGLTAAYCAPERNIDGEGATAATDWYGLGMLLRFIRLNTPGFPASQFSAIEKALLHPDPAKRLAAKEDIDRSLVSRKSNGYLVALGVVLMLGGALWLGYLLSSPSEEVEEVAEEEVTVESTESLPRDSTPSVATLKEERNKNEDMPAPAYRESGNVIVERPNENPPQTLSAGAERESGPSDYAYLKRMDTQLREEMRRDLTQYFRPLRNKIIEARSKKDFGEATFSSLQKELNRYDSNAMNRYAAYAGKYDMFTSDYLQHVLMDVLQQEERSFWKADWESYLKARRESSPD